MPGGAAIWADLTAEESGRRYDATLRRVLSDEYYQQYSAADARGTLHRLVRSAELAGHDPGTLLAQPCSSAPSATRKTSLGCSTPAFVISSAIRRHVQPAMPIEHPKLLTRRSVAICKNWPG